MLSKILRISLFVKFANHINWTNDARVHSYLPLKRSVTTTRL